MSGLELGLLDLCHVAPGSTPATALCDMTEVAQLADRLGFTRYWLAEHHSSFVAHASPELLIPLVAGMTDRIRVGTAGVLLPYRSPLKVASDFLPVTLFHQVGHCLAAHEAPNLAGIRDLDAKAPDLKGGVRESLQVTGCACGRGRTIACAV